MFMIKEDHSYCMLKIFGLVPDEDMCIYKEITSCWMHPVPGFIPCYTVYKQGISFSHNVLDLWMHIKLSYVGIYRI